MSRVIQIPIAVQDAALCPHTRMEDRAWIGRQNVERGGLYPLQDGPLHSPAEYSVVIIHPEDKAAIDHYAHIVQPLHSIVVVIPEVLYFPLAAQIAHACSLKSHEEATQAASDRLLEQVRLQHRIDGSRSLHSLPMPRIPSKRADAKRGFPKRWSSRKYRCRPG